MNFNEEALKLHAEHKGKIEIRSKVPVNTRDDLSTAYTPGVAEPCRKIHADKKEVYKYTAKGNRRSGAGRYWTRGRYAGDGGKGDPV